MNDTVRRFYSHIDIEDNGCWMWRELAAHRYVNFLVERRWVMGHRFSYELLIGPIPHGMVLDHLCRRPPCVNPWHLEPVTIGENIRRGLRSRFEDRPKYCANGHPFHEIADRNGRLKRHCKRCDMERHRIKRYQAKQRQVAS